MTTLGELARVVRSKNAGPTRLTIDLMFDGAAGLRRAMASPALTAEALAARLGVAVTGLRVIPYPPAHAVKIVIDRPILAGSPGDRDVYGAQQHGPLLDIEL